MLNYGDPDVINKSKEWCKWLFVLYFDFESVQLNFEPPDMCSHSCSKTAIFVNTCFIYWLSMMVESNFAQSCKIRSNRPNNCFLGSFCDITTVRSKEIDTYIKLVKQKSIFCHFFESTNVGYWFEITTGWKCTIFSASDTISI